MNVLLALLCLTLPRTTETLANNSTAAVSANPTDAGLESGQKELKVALLVPVHGPKPIGALYMNKAAAYITGKLNAEGAVPGHRLTYMFFDTMCHPGASLELMSEARKVGVKAFVGPACEFNCITASELAREWNMTMISYACQTNLVTMRPRNANFARTTGTFLETGRFISAILDFHRWEKVTIVITLAQAHVWLELVDEIARNHVGVRPIQWVVDDADTMKFLRELDSQMLKSYVFVLCMFPKEAVVFLKAVRKKGYFSTGKAFITVDFVNSYRSVLGNQFTGLLDITMSVDVQSSEFQALYDHIKCPTSHCVSVRKELKKLIMGEEAKVLCESEPQLAFKVMTELCCSACGTLNRSAMALLAGACKGQLSIAIQLAESLCLPNMNGQYVDGTHAALMADAFVMLAQGLKAVVDNSSDPGQLTEDNARTIMAAIEGTNFSGITGSVDINADGTRFSNLILSNLVNGTYVPVATNELKIYSHNLTYKPLTEDITWPGGGQDSPSCPTYLCPIMEPEIGAYFWTGVSIAAVVTVIGVFTAYIFVRRSKKAAVERCWIIKSEKLYAAPAFTGKAGTLMGGHKGSKQTKKSDTEEPEMDLSRESIRTYVFGQMFAKVTVLDEQVVAVKPVNKASLELTKDVTSEVNQIRRLKHSNVNQLVGACIDPGNICLMWGYCAKGSIRDVLHNTNIKLDWMFKLSFITDITKGMAYLHSSPVGVHGRLKSSNVVVDNNWCCKITDFSMPCFKQDEAEEELSRQHYYNLLWTGPELLRDRSLLARGTKKGDVYSFAIIVQEIVTRTQPFSLRTSDNPGVVIQRVMVREKPPYRPRVTYAEAAGDGEDVGAGEGVVDLMVMCWDELPALRLSFPTIAANLKKLRQAHGTTANLVDQMLMLVRRYADNLEDLVEERTRQLEEEQAKTNELLSKMLPKSVAEELKLGRPVVPECYLSVTLLFSDILGFADIALVSTPIQVVNLLNDLYICFDNIIDTYDAYKVETIADTYVVSSGLPERNGDQHTAVIATLALDLLTNVLSFSIRHIPNKQLLLRIGIHTGSVVAGVVGKKMPRYCLFGDTVNYTSRLESNGLPLHIHVSPECKECLDKLGGFHLKERGLVEMKGKGKILTYFLVGKDDFRCKIPALLPNVKALLGIELPDAPRERFSTSSATGFNRALGFLTHKSS